MTKIRTERKDRGWPRLTMAKKLPDAADNPNEVPSPESLVHNIDRWERGGAVSERYRILYCRALKREASAATRGSNRSLIRFFGLRHRRRSQFYRSCCS